MTASFPGRSFFSGENELRTNCKTCAGDTGPSVNDHCSSEIVLPYDVFLSQKQGAAMDEVHLCCLIRSGSAQRLRRKVAHTEASGPSKRFESPSALRVVNFRKHRKRLICSPRPRLERRSPRHPHAIVSTADPSTRRFSFFLLVMARRPDYAPLTRRDDDAEGCGAQRRGSHYARKAGRLGCRSGCTAAVYCHHGDRLHESSEFCQ